MKQKGKEKEKREREKRLIKTCIQQSMHPIFFPSFLRTYPADYMIRKDFPSLSLGSFSPLAVQSPFTYLKEILFIHITGNLWELHRSGDFHFEWAATAALQSEWIWNDLYFFFFSGVLSFDVYAVE